MKTTQSKTRLNKQEEPITLKKLIEIENDSLENVVRAVRYFNAPIRWVSDACKKARAEGVKINNTEEIRMTIELRTLCKNHAD